MEHYLGQITSQATSNLGKLQEIVIFSSIFSNHNVLRSDITYRKRKKKKTRENTNYLEAINSTKFKFGFNNIQRFYEVGINGTYFNIMKTKYDKTTANIILNNEKLKAFPLKSALRQGRPHSPLPVLGILATAFKKKKLYKAFSLGKKK